MIDIKNGQLSLQVGKEKLEFNLSQVMASPSQEDACYRVDVIEKVLLVEMGILSLPSNPLKLCLIDIGGNGVGPYLDEEKGVYTKILDLA